MMHEFDRMEVEYIKGRVKELTAKDRNSIELASLAEVYVPVLIDLIEKLDKLSDSQSQAIEMMERGNL